MGEAKRRRQLAEQNGEQWPEYKAVDPELDEVFNKLDEQASDRAKGLIVENHMWDEAQSAYTVILNLVQNASMDMAAAMDAFVSDPKQVDALSQEQQNRLSTLIRQFGDDTVLYLNQIKTIYALHSNKTGSIKDGDEAVELIQIHGQYNDIMEVFHTIVNPMVVEILTLIGVAEKAIIAIKEADSQENLQDPTVISDAVESKPKQGRGMTTSIYHTDEAAFTPVSDYKAH